MIMKHKFLLFFSLLFLGLGQIWGQTITLSKWGLTSNGSPNSIASNVTAGNFLGGSGISNITFGNNGAHANDWTTSASEDINDYFQITISPDVGYNLTIQELLFSERRSGTGIREYKIKWSKQNDFSSPTTIATVGVPDNT